MTVDDRLIGIAQTHIAIWEERIRLIDDGKLELFEVRDGKKVDTTADDRAEMAGLIEYQQGFIASRGQKLVR